VGSNIIKTVVTAQNGTKKDTYTVTVTRALSPIATLSNLVSSNGTLSPAFASGTTSYNASVGAGVFSITVTPTTTDPNATVTVNGTAVTSGTASQALPLSTGNNNIYISVTAQDGNTVDVYALVVNKPPSPNANLGNLHLAGITLSPTFAAATTNYAASVANGVASTTVTPTTSVSVSTVTVNGVSVASGTASGSIPLDVGTNTITTVVTAEDGVTTKTYTVVVTRAMGPANSLYQPISVTSPAKAPQFAADGLKVHEGISPNGDGINDFLVIDGISAYPDNKLTIMSRNGELVYEATGYDNSSRLFDGHSNKNGRMQQPGTYFYSLEYKVDGVTKHRTGFIVLKY
jgi:gliding motility-associated-like protein